MGIAVDLMNCCERSDKMPHKLFVEGKKLIVDFEGLEEVAALKKRLEFKLDNIVSVSTDTKKWLEGIRVGGTGLPGVIKEGRYLLKDGTAFFAMRHPDKCVTVEFKNEPYKYLVVEVDDKNKIAEELLQNKR